MVGAFRCQEPSFGENDTNGSVAETVKVSTVPRKLSSTFVDKNSFFIIVVAFLLAKIRNRSLKYVFICIIGFKKCLIYLLGIKK